MKQLLLSLSACLVMLLCALPLCADIVKGRVVDGTDGHPLTDASVVFKQNTAWSMSISTVTTDSLGVFNFSSYMTGMTTLEASYIGYKTHRKALYLYDQSQSTDTVDLGDIRLQPTSVMLEAVKVTGHLPRITMSGDTIVFHPEAFKLQDNARLLELLTKLPGVRQGDDGRFYWNNKPIRLLVDGKDIFGGSAIISQLPAEVAKKLKLYDRKSKLARHTGNEDGKEDMVLDVEAKPGFLDKWYGNIEAVYGDGNHYNGEMRVYKLSDKNPLMVFGNMNNMNEQHEIGQDSYSQNSIDLQGKQQYVSTAWQHNGKTKGAGDNNYISINPDFGHRDGWGTTYGNSQRFLPGEQQTFTITQNDNRSHSITPGLRINTQLYTDSVNFINLNAETKYTKEQQWTEYRMARFSESPSTFGDFPMDAAFDAAKGSDIYRRMLLRNRNNSAATSESTHSNVDFTLNHFLPRQKGEMSIEADIVYNTNNTRQHTDRQFDYLTEGTTDALHQYSRNPKSDLYSSLSATLKYYLSKAVLLNITAKTGYDFSRDDNDFYADRLSNAPTDYTPTALDNANTQRSRLHTWHGSLTLAPVINFSKHVHLTPSVEWAYSHDRLNLRRGDLDTLAVRSTHLLNPSLFFLWKINRAQGLDIKAGYTADKPEMLQTVDFENTIDPLNVVRGNTHLRTYGNLYSKLNFSQVLAPLQAVTSLSLEYNHYVRPISTLYTYDAASGRYTSTRVNVRGGNRFAASLNVDKSFGPSFRLVNIGTLTWQKRYAWLIKTDDNDSPALNGERDFSYEDQFTFSFETGPFNASTYAYLTTYDYRYDLTPAFNNRPLSLIYGLRLRLNQKRWIATTEVTDSYHHGYLSADINRHRVIWNGEIGVKLFHNQAALSLRAQDILRNFNCTNATISAYERSETWSTQFYHFIGVRFYYDLEPKKRK